MALVPESLTRKEPGVSELGVKVVTPLEVTWRLG
jgi:hypothetical protein